MLDHSKDRGFGMHLLRDDDTLTDSGSVCGTGVRPGLQNQ